MGINVDANVAGSFEGIFPPQIVQFFGLVNDSCFPDVGNDFLLGCLENSRCRQSISINLKSLKPEVFFLVAFQKTCDTFLCFRDPIGCG